MEFAIGYRAELRTLQLAEQQAGTPRMELVSAHAPERIAIAQTLALGLAGSLLLRVCQQSSELECGLTSGMKFHGFLVHFRSYPTKSHHTHLDNNWQSVIQNDQDGGAGIGYFSLMQRVINASLPCEIKPSLWALEESEFLSKDKEDFAA
ncbi:hypothetical protein DUI87_23516 [Hirundo rustica rustica]|uniref:Uncharacterized protein n=1 Tax=Hirundo rustica rustica TaxID=333673 RepID=A0A3M0JGK3_HIRRU|nr:hypothetical protein DUI87_23516 [Hirundo rustica rustica]